MPAARHLGPKRECALDQPRRGSGESGSHIRYISRLSSPLAAGLAYSLHMCYCHFRSADRGPVPRLVSVYSPIDFGWSSMQHAVIAKP